MIQKTEGIVLRTLKHQDSHLIARIYTREAGLLSFLIKGYRSMRSRRKYSYFQPLSLIDIVFYYRENRDLHKINESKIAVLLQEVQTHPVKLALGLAVVEVFSGCVREEESQPGLFDFLKACILRLDVEERRLIHVFIYYLLHLTRFLGFFPHDASKNSPKVEFNVQAGTFSPVSHKNDAIAGLLRRFLYSNLDNCQDITFNSAEKKALIYTLFEYYRIHIDGFRYPNSLQVYAEVFGE